MNGWAVSLSLAFGGCHAVDAVLDPGGCAGQRVREPRELYGCPCETDANCTDAQSCAPSKGRAGNPIECQNLARK